MSLEDTDAKEISYACHLGRRDSAFITPEQVKQTICNSIIVSNGSLPLSPPNHLNIFTPNPPSMCIVRIQNARSLLKPNAQWSYITELICIPAARSEAWYLCYNLKLFVQVSSGFLSVGLILIEGKYDWKLSWPFAKNIFFSLKNAKESMNRERGFKCYGNGLNFVNCLRRPKFVDNLPIEIQCFLPVSELENGFIRDNSIELHCLILPHLLSSSSQVEQLSSKLFPTQKCFINSFIIEAT